MYADRTHDPADRLPAWLGAHAASDSRRLLLHVVAATLLPVLILTSPAVEAVTLNPGDILVAADGAFGGGGGILRVDPLDGTQMRLASMGSFVDPMGIALERLY